MAFKGVIMDRELVIKELTDSKAVRKMFFNHLRRLTDDYITKRDAAFDGESPEFLKTIQGIETKFNLETEEDAHMVKFILTIIQSFTDMVCENNRKWASVLFDESE